MRIDEARLHGAGSYREEPHARRGLSSLARRRRDLAAGRLAPPPRSEAFTVFAQRSDARVEAEIWRRHAAQFFDARLELVVPKRYVFDPPDTDAAQVPLATASSIRSSTRICFGRPRRDDDLRRAADDADTRARRRGARECSAERCRTVWVFVSVESTPDRAALLVAAILASVVLGPVLSPDGDELFGVRTARMKLEASGGPYRSS